ncbi:unnamed protein product, partial [Polarella glacialis]
MVVARACPRTCHDAQALLPKSFQGANSLDSVSSSVAAHRGSCCSHLASLRCMSSKEGHTSKAELPTRQLWLSNCFRHGQVSTSTQKQRHGCKPTSCAQYDALLRHIRPAAVGRQKPNCNNNNNNYHKQRNQQPGTHRSSGFQATQHRPHNSLHLPPEEAVCKPLQYKFQSRE